MMEPKTNCILLLVITLLIDFSFSAVWFTSEYRDPRADYERLKADTVYRGLFLTFSLEKKIKLCHDLFAKSKGEASIISDDQTNHEDPQHPLSVAKIYSIRGIYLKPGSEEELFFRCTGSLLVRPYQSFQDYVVASAFKPGIIYNGELRSSSVVNGRVILHGYIGLSPEYVSFEQTQLKMQYLARRRAISALETESPKYVQKIEKNDFLSELSMWQRFFLCATILASPNRTADRNENSLNWKDYKKKSWVFERGEKGIHEYVKKPLKFANDNDEDDEIWWTDCLYCPSASNIHLTRTYDDKYSLYVLKEANGFVTSMEYARDVPILMNAREPITQEPQSNFY